MYQTGDGASTDPGSTLVNLAPLESASADPGSALVDLAALKSATADPRSTLVDLGDGATADPGSALVDLLVEDKFHVDELHVDGWWVLGSR